VTDWRALPIAELECEYSPSSAIGGNYQPFIDQYVQRSAAAREWFAGQNAASAHYGVAYGAASSQTLDVFLPAQQVSGLPPLVVFIHGGYWQALSKNESQFAAVDAVQAGLAHAVIDYTLAPNASVAAIVDECVQALEFLQANADRFGFDSRRIVVTGSSAGAHLAAMVALRCPFVRAAVLVSGIYELEPLIHTTINDALGLTAGIAQALSPQLQNLAGFPSSLLAVGEIETAQFKHQGAVFAQSLPNARSLTITDKNHFDIVLDLLNPHSELGRQSLNVIHSL
jgi:arylformamidase